jgi:hypothetical protein
MFLFLFSSWSRFSWIQLRVLLSFQLSQTVERYEDAKDNVELYNKIVVSLNAFSEYVFLLILFTKEERTLVQFFLFISSRFYERSFVLILSFFRAPFTLQRITELALRPQRFYRSSRKLFNALEKV